MIYKTVAVLAAVFYKYLEIFVCKSYNRYNIFAKEGIT